MTKMKLAMIFALLCWVMQVHATSFAAETQLNSLDERRLSKLMLFSTQPDGQIQGSKIKFNQAVTDMLGITRGEQTLTVWQLRLRQNSSGQIHGLNWLPNDQAGLILESLSNDGSHIYYVRNGVDLKAALLYRADGPLTAIAPTKAEAELQAELKFWSQLADKLPY